MSQGGQVAQCTNSQMTFGIELELLVVSPASAFKDLPRVIGPDNYAFAVVHRELLRRGVPSQWRELKCPCCQCNQCTETDCEPIKCIEAWVNEGSKVSCVPPETAFAVWDVGTDSSIDLTKAELKDQHGWQKTKMELSSRKFSLAEDDWEQEIASVLDAVDELRKRVCILLTNEDTGLHVHVGYDEKNVPLTTCKNIFQVMTCLERCLDQIHTTSRLEPGHGLETGGHYNAPLSFFHRLHASATLHENVFDWCASVESCESYKAIDGLFKVPVDKIRPWRRGCGHTSTVNFENT